MRYNTALARFRDNPAVEEGLSKINSNESCLEIL